MLGLATTDGAARWLVLGPALVFLGAVTGSPSPLQPAAYVWNTFGLTIGSLVTLAGFVRMPVSLWSAAERTAAALTAVGVALATMLWLRSAAGGSSIALRRARLAHAIGTDTIAMLGFLLAALVLLDDHCSR